MVSTGLHELLDDVDLVCCLQADRDCFRGASWSATVDEGARDFELKKLELGGKLELWLSLFSNFKLNESKVPHAPPHTHPQARAHARVL